MKKFNQVGLVGALMVIGIGRLVLAKDVDTVLIRNDEHAKQVCPQTCKPPLVWNGQWKQKGANMSVCGCDERAPVASATGVQEREAAFFPTERLATNRCPEVCKPGQYSGKWKKGPYDRTICECKGVSGPAPLPPPHHDGCRAAEQACTCGNTGKGGKCGTGPLKNGLYCKCG